MAQAKEAKWEPNTADRPADETAAVTTPKADGSTSLNGAAATKPSKPIGPKAVTKMRTVGLIWPAERFPEGSKERSLLHDLNYCGFGGDELAEICKKHDIRSKISPHNHLTRSAFTGAVHRFKEGEDILPSCLQSLLDHPAARQEICDRVQELQKRGEERLTRA